MATVLPLALRRPSSVDSLHYLRVSRAAVRHTSHYATPQRRPKKTELPATPARTRFAPSPTGYLHLGSLRTALFNYLLAKRTGGQFLLRIEDTDQKRLVCDAETRLLDDLRWAGLEWDEGPQVGGPHGPYRQSERTALYQAHARRLLETGHAYRCFCTPQRLNDLAQQRSRLGLPTDYDRKCVHLSNEEADNRAARGHAQVIRLLSPDRCPVFYDLVYGMQGSNTNYARNTLDDAYDDPILLKSDGLPTYHLANVVDDHCMKITHVIRGVEWLSSTVKHVALYNAFGWEPPAFAHVGLLVDDKGNKLSKRNMDIDVSSYRSAGYLAEAINNHVALLGWSHRSRTDVMSMQQLIDSFTMKFTRGNAIVTEAKLHFLQHQHWLRRLLPGDPTFNSTVDQLVTMIEDSPSISCSHAILDGRPLCKYVGEVLRIDAKNYTTPSEFLSSHDYFFIRPPLTCGHANHDVDPMRRAFASAFVTDQWTAGALHKSIAAAADAIVETRLQANGHQDQTTAERNAKRDVYTHLRAALANGKSGPSIVDMMQVLGRAECLARMARYVSSV